MASSPPDDDWGILPDGWSLSDVGHTGLDVLGALPVIGEPADLANAVWHAAQGNYLEAGLSLISTVPIVGDAIGKGGKILKRGGSRLSEPALKWLEAANFSEMFAPFKSKIPNIDNIVSALTKWRDNVIDRSVNSISGTAFCRKGREFEKLSKHRATFIKNPFYGKEPGAVGQTQEKIKEVLAGKDLVRKGIGKMAKDGAPRLKPGELATFSHDPVPLLLKRGQKIRRIVGAGNYENGAFWIREADFPSSAAEWRSKFAVKGEWNGNGAYVEYTVPEDMTVWIGPTSAQRSSDELSMLSGGADQIFLDREMLKSSYATDLIPTGW